MSRDDRKGTKPEPSPLRPGTQLARAGTRLYRSPQLLSYGDLRTLTLGGSPGMGDSGPTVGIRNPLA